MTNSEGPIWGDGIKALRIIKGLTQDQLAERASVPQSRISRIENGSRKVSDAARVRIAKALDVHPHELFPYLEDEQVSA